MPWIQFLERPEHMDKFILDMYDEGNPFEFPELTNMIDQRTGQPYDPPLIKPADKTTDDWKPGDLGECRCGVPGGGYVYYKFEVIDSPIKKVAYENDSPTVFN